MGLKFAVMLCTMPRDFETAERGSRVIRRRWFRTGLLELPPVFWFVHTVFFDKAKEYLAGSAFYREHPDEKPTIIGRGFNAKPGRDPNREWDLAKRENEGYRWCYGQIYARGFDGVIKIDSDCMVLRPECFTNPVRDSAADHVYRPQTPIYNSGTSERFPFDAADNVCMHHAWGPAMLFSRAALKAMLDYPQEDFEKLVVRCRGWDDQLFSRMICNMRGMCISEINPAYTVANGARRMPDENTVYICDNPRKQRRQAYDVDGNFIPA